MTNTLALWLAGLIIGFFILDAYVLHWDAAIVLMRLLADVVEAMAIWR